MRKRIALTKMLNYKNDSLLLGKETANNLIQEGKTSLLFLDESKGILNIYAALVKREDFVGSVKNCNLQKTPYIKGDKVQEKVQKIISSLPTKLQSHNNSNLVDGFFDLSVIPLRAYNTKNLIFNYKGNFSINHLSKKLSVPKSTLSYWLTEKSGIPIQKLIKLAELSGYTKQDVYNDLSNNANVKFCLIKGKGRGNPLKLPMKVSNDLLFVAQNLRASFPKLHLRNRVLNNKLQEERLLQLIKDLFGAKTRLQKGGTFRIDSATLSKFFETFFIYDYVWNLPDKDISKLKANWNNVWSK